MTDRIFDFAGIDFFLEHFRPRTPEGKKYKSEKKIYSDPGDLNRIYNRVEMVRSYLEGASEQFDKVRFHLDRIPAISNRFVKGELRSELQCIKKLLHNYRAVSLLLDERLKNEFSFNYISDPILKLLGYEVDQQESFYIKDSYSDELKQIRRHLRETEKEISRIKQERIEEIRQTFSLDFRFNDFLVVPEGAIPEGSEIMLYIEPYDNSSVVVKPQLGKKYHDTRNGASQYYKREKELEEEILISLAETIEHERQSLILCVKSLTELDLTLSRADAAIKFRCIKPEISHNGFILASNLRFLPVEENCLNERVPYTPLSAEFDAPHIVISGSNMGGKTVVLKTLLFAQILSQMGFFVPATRFKTILFRSFNLIGDKLGTGVNGLSSFGEEIMSLIEGAAKGRTLYIIDEFARTTNSAEALALNSALLKSFSGRKETWSFSSTHQENLPELENIAYWTMRGLDYLKYGEYFHSNFKGDLSERIRLINNYMDYRIEPRAAGAVNSRDALKIADILGLDSQLIGYAEKYMEKQEKQNG